MRFHTKRDVEMFNSFWVLGVKIIEADHCVDFYTYYIWNTSVVRFVATRSLRRTLGYRWHDCTCNDMVLKKAGLRQLTGIIQERQLRLYGHVARLPTEDPAHRILFCRDARGWSMPRGRPHASWLRKVESYLKDTGTTGLASAWAMARRRPI